MTYEDLLEECGGFTKYQFLIVFGIALQKLTCGWSMLQMSYAGLIPDWHCVVEGTHGNESSYDDYFTNNTFKKCSLNNSLTGFQEKSCQSYRFDDTYRTVITEWDLVCDRKWVKATVTSIQMTGVLFGAIVAGQLTSLFGRKKTLFGFSLFHAVTNIVAAFSISWEMFAAFRFFLGMAIGAIIVGINPYALEFTSIKWRPFVGTIPMWPIGVGIYSLIGYLLPDWTYLHISCGLFGLLVLPIFFFIPESVRWLALQGRFKEGVAIFEKMATMNGRTLKTNPHKVLEKIFMEEQESRSSGRTYTYWDLFGSWKQTKLALKFFVSWFTVSLVFYGISFAASSLGGSLFLNIFLLSNVQVPAMLCSFYLVNRFGRKGVTNMSFGIAAVSVIVCLLLHVFLSSDSRATWIIVLCIIAKVCAGTGWRSMQLWTSESYPTVLRTLGFGAANSLARVGGMCAPFVIDLDNYPIVAYGTMTAMLVLSVLLLMFIQETKGKILADSINAHSNPEKGLELTITTPGTGGDHTKPADKTDAPINDSATKTRF